MNEEIKTGAVELTDEEIEKTAGGTEGEFFIKQCLDCSATYGSRADKCPRCGCTSYRTLKPFQR